MSTSQYFPRNLMDVGCTELQDKLLCPVLSLAKANIDSSSCDFYYPIKLCFSKYLLLSFVLFYIKFDILRTIAIVSTIVTLFTYEYFYHCCYYSGGPTHVCDLRT